MMIFLNRRIGEVFPAHAGVIRVEPVRIAGRLSLPRACGGDPYKKISRCDKCLSSPRMRG